MTLMSFREQTVVTVTTCLVTIINLGIRPIVKLSSAENGRQVGEGDQGREQDYDGGDPWHDDPGNVFI